MPDARISTAGRIAAAALILSGACAFTQVPFWARCLAEAGSRATGETARLCAAGPPLGPIDWILLFLLLIAFPATIAWMGYLHAGLIRSGRLVSRVPAWVAAVSWIVPLVNLILPYRLLLRYAHAMAMGRGVLLLIALLWVIDILFYGALAASAIGVEISLPWRIRVGFADSIIGPAGLILTGVLVFRFARRASQI